MSYWWKYPLSEVLPFSLQAYYRLLENYGAAIWPFQLASLAVGTLLLWLIWRAAGRQHAGLLLLLLAGAWLLLAWLFFSTYYVLVFWAAPYFAIAFALQACLLLILALTCMQGRVTFAGQPRRKLAAALFAFAILGYPLATMLAYGSRITEVFGFFPDPTAAATIAAIAGLKGFIRWIAIIIPVLWTIATAAIFLTLGGYEIFTVTSVMMLFAIALTLAPERRLNQPALNL